MRGPITFISQIAPKSELDIDKECWKNCSDSGAARCLPRILPKPQKQRRCSLWLGTGQSNALPVNDFVDQSLRCSIFLIISEGAVLSTFASLKSVDSVGCRLPRSMREM